MKETCVIHVGGFHYTPCGMNAVAIMTIGDADRAIMGTRAHTGAVCFSHKTARLPLRYRVVKELP